MMQYVAPYVKWNILSAVSSGTTLLIALEFTPSELTFYSIVAGLMTALIASVTSIISLLIARQGRTTGVENKAAIIEAKAAIDENTKLTDKIIEKTDAIGANVDGLKTKDASRIAELERESVSLKQQLDAAEKRAVAAAQVAAPHTVVISGGGAGAIDTLKDINKDTTAIEKNTAATEAKVDNLKDGL